MFPIVHKISLVFAVGRLYHKNRTKKIRRPSAAGKERYEHTKENPDSLRRLLTAVLVLAPTALAAEAEIPYIPQTVPAASLLRQTRGGRRTGSCCW